MDLRSQTLDNSKMRNNASPKRTKVSSCRKSNRSGSIEQSKLMINQNAQQIQSNYPSIKRINIHARANQQIQRFKNMRRQFQYPCPDLNCQTASGLPMQITSQKGNCFEVTQQTQVLNDKLEVDFSDNNRNRSLNVDQQIDQPLISQLNCNLDQIQSHRENANKQLLPIDQPASILSWQSKSRSHIIQQNNYTDHDIQALSQFLILCLVHIQNTHLETFRSAASIRSDRQSFAEIKSENQQLNLKDLKQSKNKSHVDAQESNQIQSISKIQRKCEDIFPTLNIAKKMTESNFDVDINEIDSQCCCKEKNQVCQQNIISAMKRVADIATDTKNKNQKDKNYDNDQLIHQTEMTFKDQQLFEKLNQTNNSNTMFKYPLKALSELKNNQIENQKQSTKDQQISTQILPQSVSNLKFQTKGPFQQQKIPKKINCLYKSEINSNKKQNQFSPRLSSINDTQKTPEKYQGCQSSKDNIKQHKIIQAIPDITLKNSQIDGQSFQKDMKRSLSPFQTLQSSSVLKQKSGSKRLGSNLKRSSNQNLGSISNKQICTSAINAPLNKTTICEDSANQPLTNRETKMRNKLESLRASLEPLDKETAVMDPIKAATNFIAAFKKPSKGTEKSSGSQQKYMNILFVKKQEFSSSQQRKTSTVTTQGNRNNKIFKKVTHRMWASGINQANQDTDEDSTKGYHNIYMQNQEDDKYKFKSPFQTKMSNKDKNAQYKEVTNENYIVNDSRDDNSQQTKGKNYFQKNKHRVDFIKSNINQIHKSNQSIQAFLGSRWTSSSSINAGLQNHYSLDSNRVFQNGQKVTENIQDQDSIQASRAETCIPKLRTKTGNVDLKHSETNHEAGPIEILIKETQFEQQSNLMQSNQVSNVKNIEDIDIETTQVTIDQITREPLGCTSEVDCATINYTTDQTCGIKPCEFSSQYNKLPVCNINPYQAVNQVNRNLELGSHSAAKPGRNTSNDLSVFKRNSTKNSKGNLVISSYNKLRSSIIQQKNDQLSFSNSDQILVKDTARSFINFRNSLEVMETQKKNSNTKFKLFKPITMSILQFEQFNSSSNQNNESLLRYQLPLDIKMRAGIQQIQNQNIQVINESIQKTSKQQQNKKNEFQGYYYKFLCANEIKLVKYTLEENGFQPCNQLINNLRSQNQIDHQGSLGFDWLVLWTTKALKNQQFQSLSKYQRVNQFPRSTEITRKDSLIKRIQSMQQQFGMRHFNFFPKSFILPKEHKELKHAMSIDKNQFWISKPSSSSQGKGILITNKYQDLACLKKESTIVSHYIANPLLIDGFKFDLRIYVALTSINPLRIYMYEEGLTRFATIPYEAPRVNSDGNLNNQEGKFTHLTNYSINKLNKQAYKQNSHPDDDICGSKWSLRGFRRVLKANNVDDKLIFSRIKDIIVKTIISVQEDISSNFLAHVPHRNNCFQLFGFDIMIDNCLNPWLLEVNLSPSLCCESPLDQKIKSELVSDLLNLAGIHNQEMFTKKKSAQQNKLTYAQMTSQNYFNSGYHKSLDPQMSQKQIQNLQELQLAGQARQSQHNFESYGLYSSIDQNLHDQLESHQQTEFQKQKLQQSKNIFDINSSQESSLPKTSMKNIQIQSPEIINPLDPLQDFTNLKQSKGCRFRSKQNKDKPVYYGGSQAMHTLNLFNKSTDYEYGSLPANGLQCQAFSQYLNSKQVNKILLDAEREFYRRGKFNLVFPSFQFSMSTHRNFFKGSSNEFGIAGSEHQQNGMISAADTIQLNLQLHHRFLKSDIYTKQRNQEEEWYRSIV